MSAAILQGLTSNRAGPSSLVSFFCPSGNCDWAPYRSLGVCSSCVDVSAQLNRLHVNGGLDYTPYGAFGSEVNMTTFSLLDNDLSNVDTDDSYTNRSYNVMNVWATSDPRDTSSFHNFNNGSFLASVSVLAVDIGKVNVTSWPNLTIIATECAFMYCIRQVHSTVINGSLVESISDLPTRVDASSYKPISASIAAASQTPAADSLSDSTSPPSIPRADLHLYVEDSRDIIFSVSQAAITSIGSYISSLFQEGSASDDDGPENEIASVTAFPNGTHLNFTNQNVRNRYILLLPIFSLYLF